jgi:methyl-accepting chemotaxis protein
MPIEATARQTVSAEQVTAALRSLSESVKQLESVALRAREGKPTTKNGSPALPDK